MMQNSFKIGLLGLGFMGKRHLEASGLLPGIEVVTSSSPPFDKLPAQDYSTLCKAMIEDPTIDAIDVCLPTGMHASMTIAALDAGKHVLCEKPMALTPEDCFRMLRARDRSRGVLMVAHVLRFWPAYRFLHEVVACRAYGAIGSLSLVRKSGVPGWAPWLLRPEESGGAILDLLVHDFDQALFLFGMPESATARTLDSPNVMECSLHYPGGVEVAIAGGWYDGDVPFAMGFELRASGGELRYAGDHLQLLRPSEPIAEIALSAVDPYAKQLGYFIDCCRNNVAPSECTPESSAQAVELARTIAALAQSPQARQRIALKAK